MQIVLNTQAERARLAGLEGARGGLSSTQTKTQLVAQGWCLANCGHWSQNARREQAELNYTTHCSLGKDTQDAATRAHS